jgi:hypothetical protein
LLLRGAVKARRAARMVFVKWNTMSFLRRTTPRVFSADDVSKLQLKPAAAARLTAAVIQDIKASWMLAL